MQNSHPLDDFIWKSLTSCHQHLAAGDALALRYPAPIGPFAVLGGNSPANWKALADLVLAGDHAALVTLQELEPPSGLNVIQRGLINQMVLSSAPSDSSVAKASRLGVADVPDMLELVAMTRPGPFGTRTHEMGEYYGIRVGGKLVAMAGERMRLPDYTEVSAVCVHPDYRGHRHAETLVNLVGKRVVARGETPFLHVFSDNTGAIKLYEKLGYVLRRQFHLVVLARAGDGDAAG